MRRPLALLVVVLGVLAAAASHATTVTTIGMTVADADRSTTFFCDVLGFTRVDEREAGGSDFDRLWGIAGARARVVRLRLGTEQLELTEFVTPRGLPYPEGSRSNDLWFQHLAIVVSDMDTAYARVRPHVTAISTEPQTLPVSNPAAGGIAAFYFHDPDGHPLELIHFPPGKGDPRWHMGDGAVFLGIDHTAIAVRSTAASLAFYRDRLGFRIAGESRNVGVEQAHLTGVVGADVRITGLRAAGGAPGVELLEYVAPRDARGLTVPARANDVVHWHVTLAVDDVTAPFLVRDPDGHVLQLVAR